MKTALKAAAAALSFVTAGVSYAHDIWLLPDRFTLSKGEVLIVRQIAGSDLDQEMELELLRLMTPRFELITGAGAIDLMGELPDMRTRTVIKPVLNRPIETEGLALLTMEHSFIHTEHTREKFLEYLDHEHLDPADFRGGMGDGPDQRERYKRAFKCLLQVGDSPEGDLHKRPLGQEIEILLLQNPYELNPGDALDVQVLFEGKPLAGGLVTAFNRDGRRPLTTIKKTTDADGIARFKLDRDGFWLLRLVHLQPCADPDVEWESFWTSFSFHLD